MGALPSLRLGGIQHTELAGSDQGEALVWVVRRMEIDFRSPARTHNVLTIETRVTEVAGARIRMAQRLSRADSLLVKALVEAAMVSRSGRPRRLPRAVAEAILRINSQARPGS